MSSHSKYKYMHTARLKNYKFSKLLANKSVSGGWSKILVGLNTFGGGLQKI
mgnify:CR=1 FL=1